MKETKNNGTNWTENFYHKIEGKFPDVNDTMIQDTFKYVENHVNTVGGTFKKFCSDVVQDFFPLSVDPVKRDAKEVAPKGNVFKYKHQDHLPTEHHNEDKVRNAKSTDSHEDPGSVMAARKNDVLIKENSNLSNDVDSIEESADGPLEDTFKYVEDHMHAVGGAFKKFCSGVVQDFFPQAMTPEEDAAMCTDGNDKSAISMAEVSLDAVVKQSPVEIDAIDCSERRLGHVSTGHDENVDEFKNAMSMDGPDNSDSTLAPGKINTLTNENSDLANGVDAINDSADEQVELNSHCPVESSEASSLDILGEDADCDFGASSALSEIAYSIVSGEVTITGTGLSSDISSPEECACDSSNQLLSSTPASTISTKEGAIEKQLVSSCTPAFSSDISSLEECAYDGHRQLLPSTPASTMSAEEGAIKNGHSALLLESNGGSSTAVADSGMETINLCDEAKLGESCVFLDDGVLYDVSRRTRKLRSYKKKIQDIFASKKRLAKEYEQLAIWYGDANMDLSQGAAPLATQDLQTRHASDSEWELL